MKNIPVVDQWQRWNAPMLFEGDFAAWLKSLSPKARLAEVQVHWTDLSPFTVSTYGLHLELVGTYRFMSHRNKAPPVLPEDCTPEGFYLKAVETRRRQIGLHNPFTPTAYERLSNFSHFIYQRMADRIATSAGFGTKGPKPTGQVSGDDGLGDELDDGLSGATGADDGLGCDEDPDGLDDGLGEPLLALDDGLGDGL